MKRALAAVAAVFVVGTACAQSGSPTAASQSHVAGAAAPSSKAGEASHEKDGAHHRGRARSSKRTGVGKSPAPQKTTTSHPSPHPRKARGSGVAAAYPSPGTYVYSQSGTEEFCAGSNCDREQLPPTTREETSITNRASGHTTIVSEMRPAEGRYVRTTFDYSSDVALITEVYYSFDYNGFAFSDDYKPDPPVRSVVFPLSVGKSWSGSWQAKTSGSYSMKVGALEEVTVGGHPVRAYKLNTTERFKGEYRGTAAVTVWVDPETKAIVKTSGALQLANSFGSYDTTFTTVLERGPQY